MANNPLGAVLGAARLPFLPLTPACLLLGIGHAEATGATLVAGDVLLVLIAGLAAHVSVNALNEYADFRSGLDARTERTPFSGGSGALQAMPEAAHAVLLLGLTALAVTAAAGLYFVTQIGWELSLLGLLGLVVIAAYTPWINRSPWLCLMAPGLAFGPLMVIGTDWVLSGAYSSAAGWLSLVPFFLVNNLLLLNQFPDVDADRSVGRRHLPITHGLTFSGVVHVVFVLAAAAVVVVGMVIDLLPVAAALALLPVAAGAAASVGALRFGRQVDRLLPFLALNVAAALLAPSVLGLVLLLT